MSDEPSEAGGVERRAEIDTETVRSLQLMNGGAAAALTTMLPTALGNAEYLPLAASMLVAICISAVGLFAATVHNRLRRKCSLEYSKAKASRAPPFTGAFLKKFASIPGEPAICTKSVIWLWFSMGAFAFTIFSVVTGAGLSLHVEAKSEVACWEIVQLEGKAARFNKCTGDLDIPSQLVPQQGPRR